MVSVVGKGSVGGELERGLSLGVGRWAAGEGMAASIMGADEALRGMGV